jgi:hypothetical protein
MTDRIVPGPQKGLFRWECPVAQCYRGEELRAGQVSTEVCQKHGHVFELVGPVRK